MFLEVAQDLNAFWRRIVAAVGTAYQTPSVDTLEGPIGTACGPAGPEQLAFYSASTLPSPAGEIACIAVCLSSP